MPSADYDATAKEVRNFALLQVGIIGVFLVGLFLMLGGSDADYPPAWMAVALVVPVAIGAFFAERVWLSAWPLPADASAQQLEAQAVGIFAAHTVRKLYYCSAALLPAVAVAFIGDHGGWPIVIAGFPGVAVLAWEVYPTLRNTSMTAAVLDAQGAESRLVESFIDA